MLATITTIHSITHVFVDSTGGGADGRLDVARSDGGREG